MEQWITLGEASDWLAAGENEAPVLDAGPDTVPEPEPELDSPLENGGEWTHAAWARAHADGMSGRLSAGMATAIVCHLLLFATMSFGAPVLFHLEAVKATAPPPEPPPLEVTMVEEPDTPPPDPTPPPPPPEDPPPPPAVPDVPIPTDMTPPPPTPIDLPPPVLTPPTTMTTPVAPLAPPAPKPVKVVRHVQPQVAPPVPSGPVDAGPSDYLYAPPPTYPYAARQAHEEGTVVLLVMIDEAGSPVSVSVDQSSGYPILDRTALEAAREYRFRVGNSRQLRVPMHFEWK
jgi:protein TonB